MLLITLKILIMMIQAGHNFFTARVFLVGISLLTLNNLNTSNTQNFYDYLQNKSKSRN